MKTIREITRYPAAIIGGILIILLIVIAIYSLITIPYAEAVRLWRGGEDIWYDLPRTAAPAWTNLFRDKKLPETIILNSQDESVEKTVEEVSGSRTKVSFSLTFDYTYDGFPDEVILFFHTKYDEKKPHVNMTWITPEGEEIRVGSMSAENSSAYIFSQDEVLFRRLGRNLRPDEALFAVDSAAEAPEVLKGTYTLQVDGSIFEPDTELDAKLVVYGDVYGIAGTDHRRRDLTVALLWGTPVALMFGLLAAVLTSVTTMVIAAIGTWYGGWVDGLIQRITEINMILPVLPILIMIGTFYSRSIWVMLGALILLYIFGSAIKSYRAIFLQVKESGYIEAAQAYGANNVRIIARYLIPRIIPTLIPGLITLIPGFVFTEAALNVLGLGDPTLPTWGKVINDAYVNGALHQGQYYWILEPSILLMVTGLAFSLFGFALDRIFNPRLRGM
ncbi:MAG: ABC transporter permease [Anaerolineales bacterium]